MQKGWWAQVVADMVLWGHIVRPNEIWQDGELVIREDRIVAVYPGHRHVQASFRQDEGWIAPGLIDLHVHGLEGQDVMDGTPEALTAVARGLAKMGTTAFLATTMSASMTVLERTFRAMAAFCDPQGAALVGVHMEGPYINPQRGGAQLREALRQPSLVEIQRYLDMLGGLLRLVTLAPELPGADGVIQRLVASGVRVAAGHSNANFAQGTASVALGIRHATHLFNGMPPFHHRDPGLVGALLLDQRVSLELIVDGVHVHPATVRLVHDCVGGERLVLVTDSIRGTGLPDGNYELGGQTINVMAGVARTEAGNLAGSTLTLLQSVMNFAEFTGCPLVAAFQAASLNPARVLGIEKERGSLEKGKYADLIIVDPRGTNRLTVREGQIIWNQA